MERKRFIRLRSAAVVLQRAAQRRVETKNKSAAKIQALVRGAIARKHLRKSLQSALRIQVSVCLLLFAIPVKLYYSFLVVGFRVVFLHS